MLVQEPVALRLQCQASRGVAGDNHGGPNSAVAASQVRGAFLVLSHVRRWPSAAPRRRPAPRLGRLGARHVVLVLGGGAAEVVVSEGAEQLVAQHCVLLLERGALEGEPELHFRDVGALVELVCVDVAVARAVCLCGAC